MQSTMPRLDPPWKPAPASRAKPSRPCLIASKASRRSSCPSAGIGSSEHTDLLIGRRQPRCAVEWVGRQRGCGASVAAASSSTNWMHTSDSRTALPVDFVCVGATSRGALSSPGDFQWYHQSLRSSAEKSSTPASVAPSPAPPPTRPHDVGVVLQRDRRRVRKGRTRRCSTSAAPGWRRPRCERAGGVPRLFCARW